MPPPSSRLAFLHLNRHFSTSATCFQLPIKPAVAGKVVLPRSLLAVYGSDASRFLNGLITNKVPEFTGLDGYTSKTGGVGAYAGLLNAKGRVISDLFVYPAYDTESVRDTVKDEPAYILDVSTSILEKVQELLDFHVLASNVRISELQEMQVVHTFNDATNETELSETKIWATDPRAIGLGTRHISFSGSSFAPKLPQLSEDDYKLRRYLFGVPEGPEELVPNKTLPLDFCMDYMNGVDFQKGCYLGQELTIRTYHHGNVRKRVMPVVLRTSEDAEVSEDIYEPVDFGIAAGTSIYDDSPVPFKNTITPAFGESPFKSSKSYSKPSGYMVASLGNVGLARVRVDTAGHQFRVGETYVQPMVPFWWPV